MIELPSFIHSVLIENPDDAVGNPLDYRDFSGCHLSFFILDFVAIFTI